MAIAEVSKMKSLNKLTMFLIIAAYMLFLSGCSYKDISQEEHFKDTNTATADITNKSSSGKNISSISKNTEENKNEMSEKSLDSKEDKTTMNIKIQANGKTVIFELNDSSASKSLYDQLPIIVDVQNYSNNEKIFYPEQKLNTSDTPLANAKKGTLAYYAPWGDVVMFYGDFGSAAGLYELGRVVTGSDDIASLSGEIKIEQYLN